jgi:SAM-dependent methyltransferase
MLDALRRRAVKAGLSQRIETRLAQTDSLGIGDLSGAVDFVLAFAMVHETPSAEAFFREAAAALRPGGLLLFAEPTEHVTQEKFADELAAAEEAGFEVAELPAIRRNLAAILHRI